MSLPLFQDSRPWLTLLLSTLLGIGCNTGHAQEVQEALVGAPLPAGYHLQNLSSDGAVQIVTAGRQDAQASALVVARDRQTGHTLWKTYSTGVLVPQPLGKGQGLVNLLSLRSGAITNTETLLLRLQDGQVLAHGRVDVAGIQEGQVLLVEYDAVPPSAAYLSDATALRGRVIDQRDGQVLATDFPTPSRAGCGAASVVGFKAYGISTNKQKYRVTGGTLIVPREDDCGSFELRLRWSQIPLPVPELR